MSTGAKTKKKKPTKSKKVTQKVWKEFETHTDFEDMPHDPKMVHVICALRHEFDRCSQEASYTIDDKDILRPLCTLKHGALKLDGEYMLSGYTRNWVDKNNEPQTEYVGWLDEVRSPATGDTSWVVHQIIGTPFDKTKKRHHHYPHPNLTLTNVLYTCRVRVVIGKLEDPITTTITDLISTTGNRIGDSIGKFDRPGGPWNPAPDMLEVLERKWNWVFSTKTLLEYAAFEGSIHDIAKKLWQAHRDSCAEEAGDEEEEAEVAVRRNPARNVVVASPAKAGESQKEKNAAFEVKKTKSKLMAPFKQWQQEVLEWRRGVAASKMEGSGGSEGGSEAQGRNPWSNVRATISRLEGELLVSTKLNRKLLEEVSTSSSVSDDSVQKSQYDLEKAGWKRKFEDLVGERNVAEQAKDTLEAEFAIERASFVQTLKDKDIALAQEQKLLKKEAECADLTGYIRGMHEGKGTPHSAKFQSKSHMSPSDSDMDSVFALATFPQTN